MSPERKREAIIEALELHHRVGLTEVSTAQLRSSGKLPLIAEIANAVGRTDFADGREVVLDGSAVVVTYARGIWTIGS